MGADAYMAFVEGLPGDMKHWFAIPGRLGGWVGDNVPRYSGEQEPLLSALP